MEQAAPRLDGGDAVARHLEACHHFAAPDLDVALLRDLPESVYDHQRVDVPTVTHVDGDKLSFELWEAFARRGSVQQFAARVPGSCLPCRSLDLEPFAIAVVRDHDVPALCIEIDAVSPPFLKRRPLLCGDTKQRRCRIRLPAGKIDCGNRAPGLLEAEVVLLQDCNARAAFRQFDGGQEPDQSTADDNNVGLGRQWTISVAKPTTMAVASESFRIVCGWDDGQTTHWPSRSSYSASLTTSTSSPCAT